MNKNLPPSARSTSRIFALCLLLVAAFGDSPATAQTYNWNSTSAGTWDQTDANGWNTSVGDYPNTIGDTANFTQNILAGTAISINVTDATVGVLNLDDTGGGTDSVWTISTTDAANNKLTFDVSSGNASLTSAGATNIISAAIVLNDNLDITATNGLTLSGEISGNNAITKTGAGTLTLTGTTNTFTGPLTINSGTASVNNAGALGGVSSILVGDTSGSSDATFRYTSGSIGLGGKTITIQSGNTGTTTLSTDTRSSAADVVLGSAGGVGHGVTLVTTGGSQGGFTGNFSDPTGLQAGTAGLVTINGGSGLVLFGNTASTYTGGTVINTGSISLTAGTGTQFGTGSLTINGGSFSFNSSNARTVNGLSSLILNANFSFVGSSTGLVTFSAPVNLGSTGTATTRTINTASTNGAHSLTLNGVISNGTNGFTTGITKTGARALILGGANDYTGDTIVDDGTLTLASTGALTFVVFGNDVNNQITGDGAGQTVNLDGDFTFDLSGASTTVDHSWNIVDLGNLASVTFGGTFGVTNAGWTENANVWSGMENGATYEFSEITGVLQVVVPEPNTWTMLMGGMGMLAFCQRSRRRRRS